MFKFCIGILFLAASIAVIQHVCKLIYMMGYHVTVYTHFPGPCRLIPGVDHGSEDMETLPDGRTFITSGLHSEVYTEEFKNYYKEHGIQGRILYFDFNAPGRGVTELAFDETFDQSTFHPHGLSVIQNKETGKITMFVVNHRPDVDTIEKFVFIEETMTLQHIRSYIDPAIRIVNDIGAASEESFYITNSAYSRTNLGIMLEVVLLRAYSNVVHFDGNAYSVVVPEMMNPNGVTVSKDRKNVYVVNGLSNAVDIYDRDDKGQLTLVQEFPLYANPDNILIEPATGNLVLGMHPVMHQIVAHCSDPTLITPSKVLMVHMSGPRKAVGVTELYSEGGAYLSGSSSASIYNGTMLVGSVMKQLMYCELKYMPWAEKRP